MVPSVKIKKVNLMGYRKQQLTNLHSIKELFSIEKNFNYFSPLLIPMAYFTINKSID